jgi:threonine aldolase
LFETDCEVYFVFNGTAGNSLALASLCQSYHGVICCDQSHVETDECGAPEFFSNGSKILVTRSVNGKLTSGQYMNLLQAAAHSLPQATRGHHYSGN